MVQLQIHQNDNKFAVFLWCCVFLIFFVVSFCFLFCSFVFLVYLCCRLCSLFGDDISDISLTLSSAVAEGPGDAL